MIQFFLSFYAVILVLLTICVSLCNPNFHDAWPWVKGEIDNIVGLYKSDRAEYNKRVKEWTKKNSH